MKTNKEEDTTEENQKPLEGQEEPAEIAEETEIKGEKAEEKKEETLEELVGAEEEAPQPAEEGARPPAREEKAEEEEIIEERTYTIPLGKAWIMPPRRRAPRAMRMIRSFVNKHMKLEARKEGEEEEEPAQLVISSEVNEKVWEKGIEKPPRKIRVRAAKDKDGNVTVYLAEGD